MNCGVGGEAPNATNWEFGPAEHGDAACFLGACGRLSCYAHCSPLPGSRRRTHHPRNPAVPASPSLQKAGINGERASGALIHGLRHTFATELANANVSVYTLMKLLGHESMVTSQRYVDGAGAEVRSAAELNPSNYAATSTTTPSTGVSAWVGIQTPCVAAKASKRDRIRAVFILYRRDSPSG